MFSADSQLIIALIIFIFVSHNLFTKTKNLFGNLPHSCNLVSEFNGLVSKTGQQQCWPFYMP
jgi:hypothetical protein